MNRPICCFFVEATNACLHKNDTICCIFCFSVNTKNHEVYSDKFALRVLNLNRLEEATEEEKESDLYTYARMFKAKTWEEITMLAQGNEYAGEGQFSYGSCLFYLSVMVYGYA